jgi:hypothetical protein
MDRIRHSTAVEDLPVYDDNGANPGYFQDENLTYSQQGTVVTAGWLNQIQEELIAVIVAGGGTPNPASTNQVVTAINSLIGTTVSGYAPVGHTHVEYALVVHTHAEYAPVGHTHAGPLGSGTRMLFAQASAPTGWTQITDANLDDRMLRVVTGSGGGIGGTHSPILMDVVPNHNHPATVSVAISGGDHSHTINLTTGSDAHAHTINFYPYLGDNLGLEAFSGNSGRYAVKTDQGDATQIQSASHTHAIINGSTDSSSHTHTTTGSSVSVNTNTNGSTWTPKYFNLILCEAD